ncbi:MAG: C-terminal helicase domain-containing protein, partial [Methylophilus sp.]
DSPLGTVDSFQGSEADIVIISLVRNNHHNGLKGLGFLSDARRMNVLLSRAKWKLIIIGSLEFLKIRLTAETLTEGHQLHFLSLMIQTLETLTKEKDTNSVRLASIIPISQIESKK